MKFNVSVNWPRNKYVFAKFKEKVPHERNEKKVYEKV